MIERAAVSIVDIPVNIKHIAVNGHNFDTGAGFPTTCFKGAAFILVLKNADVAEFTWTVEAPWVSVGNGMVNLTGKGNGVPVTITGTSKKQGEGVVQFLTGALVYQQGGAKPGGGKQSLPVRISEGGRSVRRATVLMSCGGRQSRLRPLKRTFWIGRPLGLREPLPLRECVSA